MAKLESPVNSEPYATGRSNGGGSLCEPAYPEEARAAGGVPSNCRRCVAMISAAR